jgi:hypothetical protein
MDGKPKTCISRYLGGLGQGFMFWGWVFGWSLLLCCSKAEWLKIRSIL